MQIRIDDDVYQRLKSAADADKRTVGAEIDYLLSRRVELSAIIDYMAAEKKESPKPEKSVGKPTLEKIRTPSVIQGEIEKLRSDEAEELEYCQDPDEAAGIHGKYEYRISELNDEISRYYKEVK